MKTAVAKPDFIDMALVDDPSIRLDWQAGWHEHVGQSLSGKTVLDVGAGNGLSKPRLEANGNCITTQEPAHLAGVDTHDDVYSFSHDSFDVVTAFDVIEHVQEDWPFLNQLLGISRESVILTTPNYRVSGARNASHVREYTPPQLLAMCESLGSVVELRHGDSHGDFISDPLDSQSFIESEAPHLMVTLRKRTAAPATSVYVTVPNGEAWIHKHTHFAIAKCLHDRRFQIRHDAPTHRPFENNLHHCVRDFLNGGEDFWLSFDADNPPIHNPLDCVDLNKDILGFPTPVWHWTGEPGERPIYFNAYQECGDAYTEFRPQEGLQRVDAIGTGCFLVARRVFEDPVMQVAPFRRVTYEDGRVERGNDIAFCERARSRGFEIWCDFSRPCHHFVELDLTEIIRAFKGLGVR